MVFEIQTRSPRFGSLLSQMYSAKFQCSPQRDRVSNALNRFNLPRNSGSSRRLRRVSQVSHGTDFMRETIFQGVSWLMIFQRVPPAVQSIIATERAPGSKKKVRPSRKFGGQGDCLDRSRRDSPRCQVLWQLLTPTVFHRLQKFSAGRLRKSVSALS